MNSAKPKKATNRRPLLSTSDAVAALIMAACDYCDFDWDSGGEPSLEIYTLDNAVEDYRRSQREWEPTRKAVPNIDDLRR